MDNERSLLCYEDIGFEEPDTEFMDRILAQCAEECIQNEYYITNEYEISVVELYSGAKQPNVEKYFTKVSLQTSLRNVYKEESKRNKRKRDDSNKCSSNNVDVSSSNLCINTKRLMCNK